MGSNSVAASRASAVCVRVSMYVCDFSFIHIASSQHFCFHKSSFHPSVAFHVETSHLICLVNQMTDFYMRYNTGLMWVN